MTPEIIAWIVFGSIAVIALIPTIVNCFRRTWLQSLVRLVFFALGVFAAALLTKAVLPAAKIYLQEIDLGQLARVMDYLFSGTVAANAALAIAEALVSPLLFFVFFLLCEFLLLIIYTILSQALLKKAKFKGVINFLVSALLNLALCFGFVATFYMPLSYYTEIANRLANESAVQEMAGDTIKDNEFALSILKSLSENPLHKVYYSVSHFESDALTSIAIDGKESTTEEFLSASLSAANKAYPLLSGKTPTSADCRAIAEALKTNPVTDAFLGGLLHDIAVEWKAGRSFLDILQPVEIMNPDVTNGVYDAFIANTLASEDFEGIATLLALYEAFGGSAGGNETPAPSPDDGTGESGGAEENPNNPSEGTGGETTFSPTSFYDVFAMINEGSANFVSAFLTPEVMQGMGLDETQSELFSSLLSSVIDEVLALQKDDSLTAEEKDAILKEESDKLDSLMNLTTSSLDINDLAPVLETVGTSRLLSSQTIRTIGDSMLSEEKLKGSGLSQTDAEVAFTVINSVLDGLCEIKEDETLSFEQKNQIVKEETEKVNFLLSLQQGAGVDDVTPLIETIGTSKFLSSEAVKKVQNAYCNKDAFLAQSMDEKTAEFSVTALSYVVDGVLDIKNDPALTEEQKKAKIENEAECIGNVVKTASVGVTTMPQALSLVSSFAGSEILTGAAAAELTRLAYDMIGS